MKYIDKIDIKIKGILTSESAIEVRSHHKSSILRVEVLFVVPCTYPRNV